MSLIIQLICFDINYFETNFDINEENFFKNNYSFLDYASPLNIIKNFLYKNEKAKILGIKKSSSKIEINFSFQINEKKTVSFNIIVLHDFTRIYNICLSSDGYILFIRSENKKVKENLDKIIDYIKESCDNETKTYIISAYKKKDLNSNEIDSIIQYLESKKFIYDFYQMKLIDIRNKKIENNEDNEDNEIGDDEFYKKENKEGNVITFGNMIRKIYINKIQNFKEVSSYYSKNEGNSKSKCLII